MTEKKKAPAGTGIPTGANPIKQLDNTTRRTEMQEFCGKLSDRLFGDVAMKLSMAKTVLNDQGNGYFNSTDPEEDSYYLVFAYESARNREEIINLLVRGAMDALEKILADLEGGARDGTV